jgi:Arc/MetJ-type ribon-helix-helix transcriptional regulator
MAKASEKYSSVPDFIRDKFREYKKRERDEETARSSADTKDAANRGRNVMKDVMSENDFENERRQLMETIDQDNAATDQEMYRGYRKGGMVKKPKSTSRRGDGICTRGYTKGKMY